MRLGATSFLGGVGFSVIAVLPLVAAAPVLAQPQATTGKPAEPAAVKPSLRSHRVSQPPTIDGVLDDDAWREGPLETGEWRRTTRSTVVRPPDDQGLDRLRQRQSLFRLPVRRSRPIRHQDLDDAPRQHLVRRLGRHQPRCARHWAAVLSPDGEPERRAARHAEHRAGGEDPSPDYIWDSAGRSNDKGYAVEMRLPLQRSVSTAGANVHMGILFWRRVSRLGVSVAWPAARTRQVGVRAARLARVRRPAAPSDSRDHSVGEYHATEQRDAPSQLVARRTTAADRVQRKVGITSTVTLDVTFNPDFSQVESDAFQVEVNQRFPVFFSEKRPFFMEGAGVFTLAGQGRQQFAAAVHTRRIVDPVFGAKLTGASAGWLRHADRRSTRRQAATCRRRPGHG